MDWTIDYVLSQTFRAFTRNWVTLLVGYWLVMLISFAPTILCAALTIPPLLAQGDHFQPGPAVTAGLVGSISLALVSSIILSVLFTPALSRVALAAARGQRPRIAELFDFRRAGTLFGTAFLGGLYTAVGMMLLIVPGVIIALGLSMASFCVVDGPQNRGVLAALDASWMVTRGHRGHLFGLALLVIIIQSLLQGLFGLTIWFAPLWLALSLVSAPLWTLGTAVIYARIAPKHEDAAATLAA